MITKSALTDRIQSALKGGASAGVAELIDEVEAAGEAAQLKNTQARQRALDPLLSAGQIAEARQASEDACFERDRMVQAAKVLKEALVEFRAVELQAERRSFYENAIAQRNAAVESLMRYPDLASQIGAILAELVAADNAVMIANQNKPEGAEHLKLAEALARGGYPIGLTTPAPLTRLILPALAYGRAHIFGPGPGSSPAPVFTSESSIATAVSLSAAGANAGEPVHGSGSPVYLVDKTGEAA